MNDLTPSDLHDPEPPAPGERERALVAERAHTLSRRRRLLQGAGGMAVVAAVAVSVAALTAGGTSGAGSGNQVAAASAGHTTVSRTRLERDHGADDGRHHGARTGRRGRARGVGCAGRHARARRCE